MRLPARIILFTACCFLLASESNGEVKSAASHGFEIVVEREVNAAPEKVYDALVDVASWWAASHTYSGKSENLYLETRKGGWFGERLPDDGFVRHLEVSYVAPGKAYDCLAGSDRCREWAFMGP